MKEDPMSLQGPAKPAATLSSIEARQGIMTGRIRYVLAISTALAVIALVVAYILVPV
jgi:hypothetical protein